MLIISFVVNSSIKQQQNYILHPTFFHLLFQFLCTLPILPVILMFENSMDLTYLDNHGTRWPSFLHAKLLAIIDSAWFSYCKVILQVDHNYAPMSSNGEDITQVLDCIQMYGNPDIDKLHQQEKVVIWLLHFSRLRYS